MPPPLAQPPPVEFSGGCPYIYVPNPRQYNHLPFGGTPFSNSCGALVQDLHVRIRQGVPSDPCLVRI
jgi:hypothetical protein